MGARAVEPELGCGLSVLWIARFDYRPDRRLGVHRHDRHHQIFHVLDGQGCFQIDGAAVEAGPGTTILVPPGTAHGMRVTGRRSLRTLDCKFTVRNPTLLAWLDGAKGAVAGDPASVRDLLAGIRSAAGGPPAGRQARCDALLALLLLALGGPGPASPALPQISAAGPDDAVAQALAGWIAAHHAEAVDGRAMARATGYSYRHLAARCRAAFACSPVDLLQRQRVEAAQRLLLAGDQPVARVMTAVGFATPAHGSRCFARLAGLPPAAWRARERHAIGRGTVLDPAFSDRDWVQPA
jgi:AraC family transcriptional activator of pobA